VSKGSTTAKINVDSRWVVLKGYDAVAYFDLNKENRIKSRFGMKFLNPGDSLVEATLTDFLYGNRCIIYQNERSAALTDLRLA
jgi:hypothetical protein